MGFTYLTYKTKTMVRNFSRLPILQLPFLAGHYDVSSGSSNRLKLISLSDESSDLQDYVSQLFLTRFLAKISQSADRFMLSFG